MCLEVKMEIIVSSLKEHLEVGNKIYDLIDDINKFSQMCIETLKNGNKILLMGNGGSAADSQHIAAELVGRYKKERKGLAAIALTTDTSILTALGNDYNFEEIFSRQVEALAHKEDLVVGISTSGNSANVIKAIEKAKDIGCKTVGLLGKNGGKLKDIVDLPIIVPSNNTPRIQEYHILIGHIVCEIIDNYFEEV